MRRKKQNHTTWIRILLVCVVLAAIFTASSVSCGLRQKSSEAQTQPEAGTTEVSVENETTSIENITVEEETEEVGIGVSKVKIDSDRRLIMTLSDGSRVDAGYIVGDSSVKGCCVTFIDYNDRLLKFEIVEKGGNATPPADLSREGCSFVGWDASYSCIIEDTTFTAQYTEDIAALIEAEDVTASAGASGVQMTVELKNNPGIAGMTLKVGYDTSALFLTGVTYGDDFLTGGEKPNYDSDPVTLLWTSLDEVSGDSVYATLTFDVLEATAPGETYAVSLAYDDGNVFNIDEESVSFGLKDGAITIE